MQSSWMRWMAIGVMVAGVAVRESAAQEPGSKQKKTAATIVKARGPIVVDGKLDEADWQRAGEVSAGFVYGQNNVLSSEPRMTARYLWDDAYLYIGYEVFDANLVAEGSGETQGPAENQRPGCEISAPDKPVDVVEFFVIFDDQNMFWELHHTAANQFNDLLCLTGLPSWKKTKVAFAACGIYWAGQECVQDEADRTLARGVMLKPRRDGKPSTVNDDSDADTGYTGEMRLPWFGIGAPAAAKAPGGKPGPWSMGGREVSILAVFQNGDLKDRYHTSASNLKQNFFHLQTDQFPRYTIAAE